MSAAPRPGIESASWPGPAQELLLRAVLERGPDALAAWQAWRRTPQSELDPGSVRLLPLLYANLRRLELRDPALEPLERLYGRVQRANDRLFEPTADALRQLEDAGLDTMLSKGAALVTGYYGDGGVRPMFDTDVVVPARQAGRAISVLEGAGWTPVQPVSEAAFRFRHSANFRRAEGSLDLHWRTLFETGPRGEAAIWDAAIPAGFHGVSTRIPAPADLLLTVIAHGTRRGPSPPLYWVADAATIIAVAGDAIDWPRLLRQVLDRRLVLRVRESLGCLAALLGASIPADVLARLDASPVTRLERAEQRLRRRDRAGRARSPLGSLERVLMDHWRLAGNRRGRTFSDLPAYLWFRWNTRAARAEPRPGAGVG